MINAAVVKKNRVIRWNRVMLTACLLAIVVFVSLPILYAGCELIVTGIEISSYNTLAVKSDSDTAYVENAYAVRESLMLSQNPFISAMASHGWVLAVTMLLFFGIAPIKALYLLVETIFAKRNKCE